MSGQAPYWLEDGGRDYAFDGLGGQCPVDLWSGHCGVINGQHARVDYHVMSCHQLLLCSNPKEDNLETKSIYIVYTKGRALYDTRLHSFHI